MSEPVKRYYATDVPVLWGEKGIGKVQEVVLLSDHLRAMAEKDEEHAMKLAEKDHDILAYAGALGYSIPGGHDGKTADGRTPVCGLCGAKATELAALKARCEGLMEALRKYANHTCECDCRTETGCTCGLSDILASLPVEGLVERVEP